MGKHSRRWNNNAGKIDHQKLYPVEEALALLKGMSAVKFDETVTIAVRLGVNPRKSDQMVRGVAKLPHGTGKQVRVLVFCKGEDEERARAAGADFVGAEDLVEKIKGGWVDFDKAIATPEMMPKVGAIARVLGPRGLMPNPKVGTVTKDVARAVEDQKAGSVDFRVEKAGIVHAPIGKLSFDENKLKDNMASIMEQLVKLKPATAKGTYIKSIGRSSTMGPGIRVDVSSATATAGAV